MWVDRYEKEQKEHTKTNGELLQTKSDLKDATLVVKNGEIKNNTAQR
jgi:NDP-sugar pyrophosphorylase family protein